MTVFFPLDTARLRLQGKKLWFQFNFFYVNSTYNWWKLKLVSPMFAVDENRKAKSSPSILAEIIKEEGLWVKINRAELLFVNQFFRLYFGFMMYTQLSQYWVFLSTTDVKISKNNNDKLPNIMHIGYYFNSSHSNPRRCWSFVLRNQFRHVLLWFVHLFGKENTETHIKIQLSWNNVQTMLLFALLPCRLAPYRGWFPVICSLCCSNFVYFYCFHSLKASWLRGKQSSSITDLILGIAAGEHHEKRPSKLTTHDKKVRAETVGMLFICLCFPRCC